MVSNVKVGDVIINASAESAKRVEGSPYGRIFVADIIKVREIEKDTGYCDVDRFWHYSFSGKPPPKKDQIHSESAFMEYGHRVLNVPHDTIKIIFHPEKFRSKNPESGIHLSR